MSASPLPAPTSYGLPHPARTSDIGTLPLANPRLSEVVVGDAIDPAFSFRIALPSAAMGDARGGAVHAGPIDLDRPVVLARFDRSTPPMTIEVHGARLDREIDPEDFLDRCGILEGRSIVGRQPQRGASGWMGDVLATWSSGEGHEQVGRFFSNKHGSAAFVISCQTDLAHYDDIIAADFLSIGESFAQLEPSDSPFAEPMKALCDATPIGWRTALPSSWQVQEDARGEDAVSFQASRLRREPEPELTGKISLCVLDRRLAKRASEVAQAYIDAVESNGIVVVTHHFAEEPERPPFKQCWYLKTPVSRDGLGGELRCRVLLSERVWVLCGVLSPRREDDPIAWMENKRALDIATTNMELEE